MRQQAHIFKALSDETRLRILALLTQGELCVADLMAVLQLPQSTVSRHLATLRTAGLVRDRRSKVYVHYSLATHGNTLERDLVFLIEKRVTQLDKAQEDAARLREYRKG